MKKKTIIRIIDITLIVLFIIVLIFGWLQYKYFSSITCLGLSAPPKFFVQSRMIPAIGILIQLPCLVIFVRYIILKNNNK